MLQWSAQVHLVPSILVSSQLQSSSLPCIPIKIFGCTTYSNIHCSCIHTKGNWLICSQLQIEVIHIYINQLACHCYHTFRHIQCHVHIFWNNHFTTSSNSIFTPYGNACGQCSMVGTHVLNREASRRSHFVHQAHWELIPLCTWVLNIFFVRCHNGSVCTISRRSSKCCLYHRSAQLQLAVGQYTYIYII